MLESPNEEGDVDSKTTYSGKGDGKGTSISLKVSVRSQLKSHLFYDPFTPFNRLAHGGLGYADSLCNI